MKTMSTSARSAALSSTDLQTLRASLKGRAFLPGDDGYDAARQTWSVTTFEQRPAVVVMPSVAADVARAVGFAREHDLPIAHHSFTWTPPYFPGCFDLWDNVFLGRLSSHPWGAMRFIVLACTAASSNLPCLSSSEIMAA